MMMASGSVTNGSLKDAAQSVPNTEQKLIKTIRMEAETEDLDALLPQADIVACAMPGTARTKGLLHRERLLAMKPNALLLNCGRGSLIVTKDLEDVLAMGHLGGVALALEEYVL